MTARRQLVVSTLLTIAAASPAVAQAPSGTAMLEAELQRARDSFSDAYVRGDFAAMAALYTGDAVLLPDDRIVRGRADIQQYFTYGPNRTQVAHSMTPTSVEIVDANTAVEIGVWSSTSRVGDQPARTGSGRHLLVWQRVDGRWRIDYDVWHRAPAQRPEPTLVQDGVVSATTRNETFPAVDPVDGSLWFSIYDGDFGMQHIMRAPREGERWGVASPAPFHDDRFSDRAPRFSPDGSTLYFSSTRTADGTPGRVQRVWSVDRRANGWSSPRKLPAPVNSGEGDMHVSVAGNGDMYLASSRAGGSGRSDLWRLPRTANGWGEAEHLPAEINDALSQPDVLVAADASWLIVAVTDHPLGLGGDDLFLTRRTARGWTPLEHIPGPINSAEYEYGPSLTQDGRSLLFTSHRRGTADVWVIPLSALGLDPVR